MNYTETLKKIEDESYLIGMISVEDILRFGHSLQLNENSKALDLCCGYGTLLKIWSEEFGASGRGVDRHQPFLDAGKKRLQAANNHRVELVCADVTSYRDMEKYDVVLCSETIESVEYTLRLGEKFLKPGGVIVFHKLFATEEDLPRELAEFDGELYTLPKLCRLFEAQGYSISHLVTGSNTSFEGYIMREQRKTLQRIRQNPEDQEARQWAQKWNRMYFDYRRRFEQQALIGLTPLK